MENDLSVRRRLEQVETAMGPEINALMVDDAVVEIMLNPDGCLWCDRLAHGRELVGEMDPRAAANLIYLAASSIDTTCTEENPILSVELPGSGFRFQGLIPPVVQRPTFTIRKKAKMIFSLEDYVNQGIMSSNQKRIIEQAVIDHSNILIVGGTGTGKTTLSNAVLAEIAKTDDRIVIIEDTQELQCSARDTVYLRTSDSVDMIMLLKATMRLRPDRIVVGEVRGGEALALLKAWNTGHPGGLSTVHANSAREGLSRMESLILEKAANVDPRMIVEAVNMVISIKRTAQGRNIEEIVKVVGVKDGAYVVEPIF